MGNGVAIADLERRLEQKVEELEQVRSSDPSPVDV